jgi:2,3-bisphosphoglycerate-dependent phosphoglycerate mutase
VSVLILLRHGESAWNAADVFTGWIDVGLSERGEKQAGQAGAAIAARGYLPEVVHTSVQRRAIRTADLALSACGRAWVPVRRSWRLNSNHYGALQGRSKPEVRAEAGEEQFMLWRRGFRVRPPLGEPDDDPRYAVLPPDIRPRGESLHDVLMRLLPWWYDAIVPDLCRRGCVLVVSHGNTLRALVKHLEKVSDEATASLEVPNAVPLYYEFDAGHVSRLADLRWQRGAGGQATSVFIAASPFLASEKNIAVLGSA